MGWRSKWNEDKGQAGRGKWSEGQVDEGAKGTEKHGERRGPVEIGTNWRKGQVAQGVKGKRREEQRKRRTR